MTTTTTTTRDIITTAAAIVHGKTGQIIEETGAVEVRPLTPREHRRVPLAVARRASAAEAEGAQLMLTVESPTTRAGYYALVWPEPHAK